MTAARIRSFAIFLAGVLFGATFSTVVVYAWTGPISAPPNSNVSAPVNIGTTDQVKNSGLSVNSLAVFGNSILSGTTNYLNFGTIAGTTGYGIRNNSGVMEVKNTGGAWARIATTTASGGGEITAGTTNYLAKYSSATALTESLVFDNGTNVGIATTSPVQKFSVVGNAYFSGNVYAAGYFHNSDRNLKENIETLSGLDIVKRLRGVSFNWKKDGTPSAGVIAQELEDVLPSAVHTDADGMKTVQYDQLIAPLIEAVKTQEQKIEAQNSEIQRLQKAVESLMDEAAH